MGDAPPLMRRAAAPAVLAVLAACTMVCLVLAGCAQSSAQPVSAKSVGAAHPATTHLVTINSGGHARQFIVYAPGAATTSPRPLVLVYHGATDTAAHTVSETDFEAVAQRDHEIVAFLQGYDDTWNEGAGDTPAHAAGINDVAFTSAVLHWIESHDAIDRRQIAASGISNGALLVELLGCRLAGELTLIAPVEGELPVSVSPSCHPSRPVSVFEVHGTADMSIPYDGGHFDGVGGGTTVLSAPASAARWAELDRCGSHSGSTTHGSSTDATYRGCSRAASVTLDTIHGGTHAWPSDIAVLVTDQLRAHPASRPAAAAK
jgi:polyhydroxybutyrate depolymerase